MVLRENCTKCYLLFYLLWWPHFLISMQHFCWFLLNYLSIWNTHSHTKFQHKSQKNMIKLLVPKSEYRFENIWGMMLWIMSGIFNLKIPINKLTLWTCWFEDYILRKLIPFDPFVNSPVQGAQTWSAAIEYSHFLSGEWGREGQETS